MSLRAEQREIESYFDTLVLSCLSAGALYRLFCIASNVEQTSTCVVVKTVLIADDSASVRLSVRLLLQGRHKELVVREAFDGIDAIRKAKTSQPDLILLDLAMPRLNGAEAAYVLKNDMPPVEKCHQFSARSNNWSQH